MKVVKFKETVKLVKRGYVGIKRKTLEHIGAEPSNFITITINEVYRDGKQVNRKKNGHKEAVRTTVKLQVHGYVRLPKNVIEELQAEQNDLLVITITDIYKDGELMPRANEMEVIEDETETSDRKGQEINRETTS